MNKTIPATSKEYDDETAAKFVKAISAYLKKGMPKGDGEFEVVASTAGVDRDGEMIQVEAWNTDNFMKNPVVLFGHDYWSKPVGAVTSLSVADGKLVAHGIFARTEAGQEIRRLYDDGILKAVSVGFIVRQRDAANPLVITAAELLELSFVPVPANPDALSLAKMTKVLNYFKITPEGTEASAEADVVSPDGDDEKKDDEPEGVEGTEGAENTAAAEPDVDKGIGRKEGRVLSGKNRTLITNAMTALQELLDASEPEPKSVAENVKDIKKFLQDIDKSVEKAILKAKEALSL
jgi:HK97 family phage prohead protease